MKKSSPVRNTDTTKANAKRVTLANEFALKIYKLVEEELQYDILANANFREINNYQIAKALNDNGHKTRTGREWTQNTVKLIYQRVKERGLADD